MEEIYLDNAATTFPKPECVYQAMDEIDHILKKSGMWVGSIKLETAQQFVYNYETATMENREVEFVPAMVKLVDEIISNSCDEFRRKDNLGLTEIDVTVDDNGWITVRDNGGIAVVKHKDAGVYLPEFLFGQLRSSSNYDDSDYRDVDGGYFPFFCRSRRGILRKEYGNWLRSGRFFCGGFSGMVIPGENGIR